jgi:hypothetical protein
MPTPNIDRMAGDGLVMNQFLVEAACTPSRAALIELHDAVVVVADPGSPMDDPRRDVLRVRWACQPHELLGLRVPVVHNSAIRPGDPRSGVVGVLVEMREW